MIEANNFCRYFNIEKLNKRGILTNKITIEYETDN